MTDCCTMTGTGCGHPVEVHTEPGLWEGAPPGCAICGCSTLRQHDHCNHAPGRIFCHWCGKPNRTASDFEQDHHKNGWRRLCARCANRRLDNPWSGLLRMRRVTPTSDPDAPSTLETT